MKAGGITLVGTCDDEQGSKARRSPVAVATEEGSHGNKRSSRWWPWRCTL